MARTRLAMRSFQLARVVGVAALALGVPVVGPVSPASAAGCSESTKFVQELATNPVTGDNDYFGIRGSAYTFNHLPMCSGTGVAQSFFVRFGPDYSSWVEMGASQYSNDTANHTHAWAEWRYLPSQSALKTYDTAAGILGTGLTYSFMLQNGTVRPGTYTLRTLALRMESRGTTSIQPVVWARFEGRSNASFPGMARQTHKITPHIWKSSAAITDHIMAGNISAAITRSGPSSTIPPSVCRNLSGT